MKWALFKFQIKVLGANWYRLPFLLAFIFLQIAFVLTGSEGSIYKAWFTPVTVILFTLIISQSFHEVLKEDLEDGSLFWLRNQGAAPALYFLITAAAFCVMTLIPTLMVVMGTWILREDGLDAIFVMSLALSLIGIQSICLGGALSISALITKVQGMHLTLPLCLIPLGLPSLLLISGLDQGTASLSTLSLLMGLTLTHIAIGIGLFTYALKS
ncbi:MAG: hypothetical protein K2Q34_01950 [Alphaproteobacteria bacterium]|nr:hypothetical protein [Alphaproteobacteria bacterium]